MKVIGKIIGALFALGGVLLMLATPALGLWLASSLVSLHGGPRGLALLGGLLLFPVLPALWEMRATSKWKKKIAKRGLLSGPPKRLLKGMDRLILRTLFLNLAFISVLLVWYPKTAFTALATRGDWFLGTHHEPWAETSRKWLFGGASGLEWLHKLANPNPYKKQGDEVVPSNVEPVAEKRAPKIPTAPTPRRGETTPTRPTEPAPTDPSHASSLTATGGWTVGDTHWPRENVAHPVLESLGRDDEVSIESLGRFIATRVTDPFERVKALHDWMVTRLHYDQDSIAALGHRKPQDARSVFANRMGVCEGYARLLVELGKATGDNVVFVVGDVREADGAIASVGHAWNAVEVQGKWYIVDATWDDPLSTSGDVYRTDYLFIPPSVAIFDHLPEEPRWQLLPEPMSRGDFLRQPFARPGLAREGLTLRIPDRSTVEVSEVLDIELDNPRGLYVSAQLELGNEGGSRDCGMDSGSTVRLRCQLPGAGRYVARLYTNRASTGRFGSVAAIDVTAR